MDEWRQGIENVHEVLGVTLGLGEFHHIEAFIFIRPHEGTTLEHRLELSRSFNTTSVSSTTGEYTCSRFRLKSSWTEVEFARQVAACT
jgi:hypothetical protein